MSTEPPLPPPSGDTSDEPGPHIFEPEVEVDPYEPSPPRAQEPTPAPVKPASLSGGDGSGKRTLALAAVFAALLGGAVAAGGVSLLDNDGTSTQTVTAPVTVSQPAATAAPATTTPADPLGTATTAAPSRARPLADIYDASAPGVVSVATQGGSGSGFVIDSQGYILTNQHVVENATEVSVGFADGGQVPAKVVGTDPSTDVALLKVDLDASALHPLPLGDSSSVRVGDAVVAIGNPFGLDRTLTAGIVSAKGRTIESPANWAIEDVIQTDASINRGNSGGPLLDARGAVIGINSQIEAQGGPGNIGIGFAVPINTVKDVADDLRDDGHVSHPYLGISGGGEIDETLRTNASVPTDAGVLVASVTPGGPAGDAGLRAGNRQEVYGGHAYCLGGDVITAIDGEATPTFTKLREILENHAAGDTVKVTVARDGASKDLQVQLDERPQTLPQSAPGCGG
jgi:S1-C subfamily serine protease